MKPQSNSTLIGKGLLATLWGMIGAPVILVLITGIADDRFQSISDFFVIALTASLIIALAGYAGSLFILRRWFRK